MSESSFLENSEPLALGMLLSHPSSLFCLEFLLGFPIRFLHHLCAFFLSLSLSLCYILNFLRTLEAVYQFGLTQTSQQPCDLGNINIPISQMEKLKHGTFFSPLFLSVL